MTLRRLLQGLSIALVLALGIGGCETDSQTDTQTDSQTDRQITQACTDLVLDYALYRDQLDAENLAALFTKDARLSVQGQTYVGRDAIRARIQNALDGPITRHLMSTIRIQKLSADRATGISYVTVYAAPSVGKEVQQQGDLPQVDGFAIIGNYIDEFERSADGWRIASRRLEGAFRSR